MAANQPTNHRQAQGEAALPLRAPEREPFPKRSECSDPSVVSLSLFLPPNLEP